MDTVPHDWRAVGLDVTSHYHIDDEDKPYVERIIDTFFYDRTEHTHLCEMTPSYFLRYLSTFIVSKENTPEHVREHLDQKYCYEPTEDSYVHVSDVDRITEFTATYGEDADEETVREYWSGNTPF